MYTRNCIEGSNPSFTAIFETRQAPEFIEEFQGFCGFWGLKKGQWEYVLLMEPPRAERHTESTYPIGANHAHRQPQRFYTQQGT